MWLDGYVKQLTVGFVEQVSLSPESAVEAPQCSGIFGVATNHVGEVFGGCGQVGLASVSVVQLGQAEEVVVVVRA
jgi:threonine dehydrogenase-like Zn-dependent dehydrogenase